MPRTNRMRLPLTMTLPLVFLAAVTLLVGGAIPFGKFVSSDGMSYTIHIDWRVAGVSLCVAAAGIALATWMYLRERQLRCRPAGPAVPRPAQGGL